MTPSQDTAIVDALTQAVRAGFAVTFRPCIRGGVEMSVHAEAITVGTASERVDPFIVVRESLRDAAANGLNVLVLDIGI